MLVEWERKFEFPAHNRRAPNFSRDTKLRLFDRFSQNAENSREKFSFLLKMSSHIVKRGITTAVNNFGVKTAAAQSGSHEGE